MLVDASIYIYILLGFIIINPSLDQLSIRRKHPLFHQTSRLQGRYCAHLRVIWPRYEIDY